MQTDTAIERDQWDVGGRSVSDLCNMAARGLEPMLDPEKQLFCYTYRQTGSGLARVGLSPRYTMMTLLGLHRYESSGQQSLVSIVPVLEALLRDLQWVKGVGDLGLLLWTCAEIAPDRIPEVYEGLRAQDGLEQFADGQLGCTMEAAWYLTGLASCTEAGCYDLPKLEEQAQAAKQLLKQNCGIAGVYGHRSRSKSLAGYLRRRIGSFADQVYPTIALARLYQVTGDQEAREMALRTAITMCKLQGPLGEWSWQYDATTAGVVSRYPLYSVHQHAMAPMMLVAAGEASGSDFSEAIFNGLTWIGGYNELRRDFIHPELGLVWRCVCLPPVYKYFDAGMRFVHLRKGAVPAKAIIRYECRPYELGWLLYAFTGRCFHSKTPNTYR